MAIRNNNISSRKIYIGTNTEIVPNDGDALISGYVGINQTNPTYRLTIGNAGGLLDSIKMGTYDVAKNTRQYIGYARQDTGLFETASSGNTPSTVLAGVAGIRIVNTEGTVSSSKADQSVQLLTHIYNGNSRVTLHANYDGNVGIGTTSPEAPLSFDNVVGSKIDFYHDTSFSDRYGIEVQNSELRIHSGAQGSSTGGITFGKKTTSTFTEAMRIRNDGKVGIGTTSPSQKLEVVGNAKITDSIEVETGSNPIRIGDGFGSGGSATIHKYNADLYLQYNNGSTASTLRIGGGGTSTSIYEQQNGNYNIGRNEQDSYLNANSGNVGIGTTNPSSAKLVVSGSDTIKTAIHIDNISTGGHRWDIASIGSGVPGRVGNLQIRNDSDSLNIVEITGSGNVGIGTTDPGQKLEVVGNIRAKGDDPKIYVTSTATGGEEYSIQSTSIGLFGVYNGASSLLSIKSDGNVGIGTTSQTDKLDVSGTVRANQFRSLTGTYTSTSHANKWQRVVAINYSTFSFDAFKLVVNCGGDTSNLNINAEVYINFKFQNNNGRIYANIVNYGDTPLLSDNFEIYRDGANGVIVIYQKLTRNYQTPSWTLIGSPVNATYTWLGNVVGTDLSGETNDAWTSKTIINGISTNAISGDVGIGTTSPGYKLDVNGSFRGGGIQAESGPMIFTYNEQPVLYGYIGFGAVPAAALAGVGDSGINSEFPASEAIRIAGNGNVGIGTTNPGQKLDVAGNIECNSLYLNNGSSTYFVPTYYGTRIKANCAGLLVQNGSTYQAVYASAFSVQSDYRLKSNVVPLDNAIDRLKQMSVHRFNWNDRLDEPKVDGFIAHELSEVIPEAVLGEKDATKEDGTPDYQGIDQSKIVPLLTAALQDAITKIEQLETRIQTLENNN